jgi:phage shock protein PspC (stress-responsive transcriptional regulator)
MHKVISINLNGNAYQLDDEAYEALRAYLDGALHALRDNPDRTEIVADLEQAIAEKCGRYLGPQKTVVLKSEIDQIIREMGPVESGQPASADAGGTASQQQQKKAEDARPQRLFRIREGAMFAGVCSGLAAYFNLDVTLIRVLFVIGVFITSGVAILAYFVMMLVVPEANTPDEHAAAHGLPFNAQEIVDRATRFAKGDAAWRRHWRRKERRLRREWRSAMDERRWRADDMPGAMLASIMVPVFMVINLALFVVLLLAIHTLATTGGIAGWVIPPDMPFWVAILLLVLIFGLVTSPLSAARAISYRAYGHYPVFAVLSGLVWLSVVGFLLWIGSQHQPEIRDFIQSLPAMWNDVWTRLQQR